MSNNPSDLLRILIVDDDTLFLNFMSLIFRDCVGFSVATATSTERGIAEMSLIEPDLVLLDIHMKEGEDGIKCCSRMRRRGFLGPIVMMTGDNEHVTIQNCFKAGANDYIIKGKDSVDPIGTVASWFIDYLKRVLTGMDLDPIVDSACLRSMGLSSNQINLLMRYSEMEYPTEKHFAYTLGVDPKVMSMRISRIKSRIKVDTLVRLARFLTILEMRRDTRPPCTNIPGTIKPGQR